MTGSVRGRIAVLTWGNQGRQAAQRNIQPAKDSLIEIYSMAEWRGLKNIRKDIGLEKNTEAVKPFVWGNTMYWILSVEFIFSDLEGWPAMVITVRKCLVGSDFRSPFSSHCGNLKSLTIHDQDISLIYWHMRLFPSPWWNHIKMQLEIVVSPLLPSSGIHFWFFKNTTAFSQARCGKYFSVWQYPYNLQMYFFIEIPLSYI